MTTAALDMALDIKKKQSQRKVEDPDKIFDSSKNWSIMIRKDLNDVRNEIMRRTKSNQIKRRIQSRPEPSNEVRPIVDYRTDKGEHQI